MLADDAGSVTTRFSRVCTCQTCQVQHTVHVAPAAMGKTRWQLPSSYPSCRPHGLMLSSKTELVRKGSPLPGSCQLAPVVPADQHTLCRDPWVLPMDAAARSAAARTRERLSDAGGGFSDHMAMVAAFREWDMQGSPAKAAAYARANFVSAATMAMVSGMRKQVLQELQASPARNLNPSGA